MRVHALVIVALLVNQGALILVILLALVNAQQVVAVVVVEDVVDFV